MNNYWLDDLANDLTNAPVGDKDTAIKAAAIWRHWPQLYGVIRTRNSDSESKELTALGRAIERAAHYLGREAERLEIDSGPLWEAGRYCNELIVNRDGVLYTRVPSIDSTWPNFLGNRRRELSKIDQAIIAAGEAVFMRLVAKLEIGELKPPGNPKRKRGQATNSTLRRDLEWLEEKERDYPHESDAGFARIKSVEPHTMRAALRRAEQKRKSKTKR